jgi:ABC-type transport system involved in cytochrome c biogenesis permease subunit
MYFIFALSINQLNKNKMKNANTFLALMFITSILMLVSIATANIDLLIFSEVFFIISGSTFYIINKNLKKQENAKRF